ncbi:MAG: ATP-binding protein [Myxococcota bacterium]|nr:ATP-binding protein [Myxococcota bacterium]
MRIGVRRKLFFAVFALVFLGVGATGAVLSHFLSNNPGAVANPTTLIFIGGGVAIGIALIVSAVFSRFLSSTLRILVDFARKTAEGQRRGPIDIVSHDDFGGLAGSLNRLSEQLEGHVTALADERDRFEAILNGMSEAVLALDEAQRVTLINRAAIMLLGLGDGPIGHTLLETVRAPALHAMVVDVNERGEAAVEFDLPGTEHRRILARATRRKSGGAVVVLRDMTELRQLENVRRDFVSNVSHELRTPVSIIRANAETLLDGAIDNREAAVRFLTSMVTNAERLSNLISDLLDVSRIEAGKYELVKETVPVSLALRRAAAALETQAIEKDFSIQVQPAGDLGVVADTRALDQVLFNFTDNAVKYSPKGGRVLLRAREEQELVCIEVEDNGPGIEPEHRNRLFERFYRVDPGRSREMGGTGLGLAIAKHLATAMNGEVGMTAGKISGSVFWIKLPRAQASR